MSTPRNPAAEDSTQDRISYDTVFGAVADHFTQDLREFFVRANFYLAVHAALLSVIGLRDAPDTPADWAVTLIISVSGVGLAILWGFVSHGSVLWIRRWRKEIQELSLAYSPTKSYDDIEKYASHSRYQSAEELTKFLPWFFAIVWIVLPIALCLATCSSS